MRHALLTRRLQRLVGVAGADDEDILVKLEVVVAVSSADLCSSHACHREDVETAASAVTNFATNWDTQHGDRLSTSA
jgi:hypothetical protein